MPITVFDGVAKFRSDTTDLEKFTTLLGRVLPTAAQDAAAATLRLKSAKQEFTAAVKEAAQYGGQNEEANKRLSNAEKELALAARAATAAHTNLNVSLDKNAVSLELARTKALETTATMRELSAVLKEFALPLLAGAGAFGLGELVKDAQQSVLSLELLSEKTGIAIETMAGLEEVAKQNGIAFDQVSTAMVRLARSQTLAIEGGLQQQQAFQRIGISVEELKNLTPEQLFYRLADAMQSAKNPGDAAATAIALLGRGGAALIPILRQGSEALREHIEEAGRVSGVDEEAGASAKDWEATMAKLSATFRSVAIPVMEVALPVVKGLETAFRATAGTVEAMLVPFTRTFGVIATGLAGLDTVVIDTMKGNFKAAAEDANLLRLNLTNEFRGFADDQKAIWSATGASISQIWKQNPPLKAFNDDATDTITKTKKTGADLIAAEIEIQSRRLDEKKRAESAALDVEVAMAKLALANQQITAAQELEIEDSVNERKYQLEVKLLQDRIALWAKDPTKSAEKAAELNAQIETLEQQHYTKLITDTANYTNQVTKLLDEMAKSAKIAAINADITVPIEQRLPQFLNDMIAVENAFKAVGLTSTAMLAQNEAATKGALDAAKRAYQSGVATLHDYQVAQQKELQTEIALAKARGEDTTQLEKQLAVINKILGTQDKTAAHVHKRFVDLFALWKAGAPSAAKTFENLGEIGKDALNGLGMAFEQAVATAILSEDSFGAALEKATAQVLAQVAAESALYAIFYTALGFAKLAMLDFSGAANAFTAAGLYASVAGAAGAAAHAINPGQKQGSEASAGSQNTTAAAGAGAGTAPKSPGAVGVVPHGSTQLVGQPTLALIGGTIARTEQPAPMAVVIANPAAHTADAPSSATAPVVEIHMHGGIDNLIKTISHRVQRGYNTLYASNSYRTTRRG